jgi:hypothetical protein
MTYSLKNCRVWFVKAGDEEGDLIFLEIFLLSNGDLDFKDTYLVSFNYENN